MNLANRITLARIALVPLVLVAMSVPMPLVALRAGGRITTVGDLIATALFLIAAGTDGVDGYIARKRNLITNFGKFIDPLADKLLVSGVLIALVGLNRMPAWIAIVIISREFAVTGLRLVASGEGAVIAASSLGKWKTRLQIAALAAIMINDFPFSYIGVPMDEILLYGAAAMTIISGWDYFKKNWHVMDAHR